MNSEEERTRYDRQVRLWGVATQQQISASRLTVVVPPEVRRVGASPPSQPTTPSGIVGEVSKNLVLAGVGALDLLPFTSRGVSAATTAIVDNSVYPEDLSSNFYLRGSGAGTLRSSGMVTIIQDLNPFVTVSSQSSSTPTANTILFEHYNLLELAAEPCNASLASNEGTKSADSHGGVSSQWGCVALGPYSVVLEVTEASNGANVSREALSAKLSALLTSRKGASQPNSFRICALTFFVVKKVINSHTAEARCSTLVCWAHTLLSEWGLHVTQEVTGVVQAAVQFASELLTRYGIIVLSAERCDPCPSVVDVSIIGGLISQRMIGAISASPTVAATRVYTFCANGHSLEATVGDWE